MIIVATDYYVGFYKNGQRVSQGKDLDAETLFRTNPGAEVYRVPDAVYEELYDGEGYPDTAAELPLARFERVA